MTNVTITNKKMKRFSIILSSLILLSSLLFVGRGVWLNTYGVLSSPPSFVGLIKYSIRNIQDYVPFNYYSPEFTGIHIERASREGLTGINLPDNDRLDMLYQYTRASWASLLSWAAIITALILSYKIYYKREDTTKSALPSILGMWCCVVGTLTLSKLTLLAFNYISMPLMFAFSCVGSIIIYKYSISHMTAVTKSSATVSSSPASSPPFSKNNTPTSVTLNRNEIICPSCHKKQLSNRTSCYSCGYSFELVAKNADYPDKPAEVLEDTETETHQHSTKDNADTAVQL